MDDISETPDCRGRTRGWDQGWVGTKAARLHSPFHTSMLLLRNSRLRTCPACRPHRNTNVSLTTASHWLTEEFAAYTSPWALCGCTQQGAHCGYTHKAGSEFGSGIGPCKNKVTHLQGVGGARCHGARCHGARCHGHQTPAVGEDGACPQRSQWSSLESILRPSNGFFTHPRTHARTHSHTRTVTHTHSHARHTHAHTHTDTRITRTHTHTHTDTHTHTHTHTATLQRHVERRQ